MLSASTRNALSMENIRHQLDPTFYNEVVDCFKRLRDSKESLNEFDKSTEKAIEESGLLKITKKYTNVTVNLTVSGEYGYQAFVLPPQIDKNHPLVNAYRRVFFTNNDYDKVRKNADKFVGSVDLEKGKVSGAFAEIESQIFIAAQLIKSERFTPEEVACIYLHELGHVMTFYIYLDQSILVTHVLGDLKRRLSKTDVKEKRLEILKDVRDDLELDDLSDDDLAEVKGDLATQTLFISSIVNNTRQGDVDNVMVDYVAAEALADQYVSRLGAGRSLATGLDKLHRAMGSDEYLSRKGYLFRSIGRLLGYVFASAMTIGIVPLVTMLMIAFSVPVDDYDDLGQRINRIRNDIVDRMKDSRLTKEQRRSLKEDLEAVDDIQTDIKERSGMLNSIWFAVNPRARNVRNRMKYIHQLENLANNDLFAMSNKLKSMS